MIRILRAAPEHLTKIVPLFDAYRVFYKQDSDKEQARSFIQERMDNNESVIFIALQGETPVWFTQLYPSFSSVSLEPLYILNDLYVKPSHRKKGIGEELLNYAKEFCLKKGYKGLSLETASDNQGAQKLYERLEWQKDTGTFHYFWKAL